MVISLVGPTDHNNQDDCKAPAGFYYDIATRASKKCPKGTFTTAENRAAACTACPKGTTTPAPGADSDTHCSGRF